MRECILLVSSSAFSIGTRGVIYISKNGKRGSFETISSISSLDSASIMAAAPLRPESFPPANILPRRWNRENIPTPVSHNPKSPLQASEAFALPQPLKEITWLLPFLIVKVLFTAKARRTQSFKSRVKTKSIIYYPYSLNFYIYGNCFYSILAILDFPLRSCVFAVN